MLSRTFLLAAVAALATASNVLVLPCNSCNCCDRATEKLINDGGVDKCYNEAVGSICTTCTDCPAKSYNKVTQSGGLSGASSGGSSVGAVVQNGMVGYVDVAQSRFDMFPSFILGALATPLDRDVADSFFYEYDCETAYCDLYFFTYRCNPCNSSNIQHVHNKLVAENWVPNACGPVFSLTPTGYKHPFTVYHKEVTKGLYVFATEVAADFVWGAIQSKNVLCSSLAEPQCNDNYAYPECSWSDAGECVTSWCPKKQVYVGPNTGCPVCPKNNDYTLNVDDIPRS